MVDGTVDTKSCGFDLFIEEAVRTMKMGETLCIDQISQYGIGEKTKAHLLSTNTTMQISLELKPSVYIQEKESSIMTVKEKTEITTKLRKEGNELLEEGQYAEALKKYEEALKLLEGACLSPKDARLVRDQRVSCFGAIQLAKRDFEDHRAAVVLKEDKEVPMADKTVDTKLCEFESLIEEAVRTLKMGETLCINQISQYGIGDKTKAHLLSANATVQISIELKSSEDKQEKESSNMTVKEKTEITTKLRKEGNELLEEGQYAEALKKYEEALKLLEGACLSPKDARLVRDQRVSCFGAIQLAKRDFEDHRAAVVLKEVDGS